MQNRAASPDELYGASPVYPPSIAPPPDHPTVVSKHLKIQSQPVCFSCQCQYGPPGPPGEAGDDGKGTIKFKILILIFFLDGEDGKPGKNGEDGRNGIIIITQRDSQKVNILINFIYFVILLIFLKFFFKKKKF